MRVLDGVEDGSRELFDDNSFLLVNDCAQEESLGGDFIKEEEESVAKKKAIIEEDARVDLGMPGFIGDVDNHGFEFYSQSPHVKGEDVPLPFFSVDEDSQPVNTKQLEESTQCKKEPPYLGLKPSISFGYDEDTAKCNDTTFSPVAAGILKTAPAFPEKIVTDSPKKKTTKRASSVKGIRTCKMTNFSKSKNYFTL